MDDRDIERIVGHLLQLGVILSAVIALLGGILYLARYGAAPPSFRVFRGEPSDLRSVAGVWRDALSFRSRGWIQIGLLVLIATPVARVIFLLFAFARERDRLYTMVTLIVLGLLLYSLTGWMAF